MSTKNDIISLRVTNLEKHKEFLEALQFDIVEMSQKQLYGKVNDKIELKKRRA